MDITMLESYLLVGKHGAINVLKTGKNTADNLLHCLAGDTLQKLPLGSSLLHDAEAGTDDRADVAVGQRRRRAAARGWESWRTRCLAGCRSEPSDVNPTVKSGNALCFAGVFRSIQFQ